MCSKWKLYWKVISDSEFTLCNQINHVLLFVTVVFWFQITMIIHTKRKTVPLLNTAICDNCCVLILTLRVHTLSYRGGGEARWEDVFHVVQEVDTFQWGIYLLPYRTIRTWLLNARLLISTLNFTCSNNNILFIFSRFQSNIFLNKKILCSLIILSYHWTVCLRGTTGSYWSAEEWRCCPPRRYN